MIRLKDIAARAGVSVMTVSKALRSEPDVSAATRERIRQMARQLGYVPNSTAQGLRSRTSKMFGVVVSSISNPVFTRMVRALEETAAESGYDVLIGQSMNRPEQEEICLRRMLGRRVDGVFISPVYRIEGEAPIYHELLARGTPVVLLGHPAVFCNAFTSVAPDDALASYHVTKHLLELGHRRIVFLSGKVFAPWARERLEGYQRALREAGFEPDDRLVFNAGSTIEDGRMAGLQMLNENSQFTAIQAVNDLVAIGCAETMLSQGLKIPQDFSLAGFGNILVSEHFRVPLTTVRQPKYRLGVTAMETMARLLRRDRTESRRLPAELIVRESTAPVPPRAV